MYWTVCALIILEAPPTSPLLPFLCTCKVCILHSLMMTARIGIKTSRSKKKKVCFRLEIVISYSDIVLPSHSGLYIYYNFCSVCVHVCICFNFQFLRLC